MVKARDLLAEDVVVLLGERLTVAATPRVEGNTAVVATDHGVTLYLRPGGHVTLAGGPGPADADRAPMSARPRQFQAAP